MVPSLVGWFLSAAAGEEIFSPHYIVHYIMHALITARKARDGRD